MLNCVMLRFVMLSVVMLNVVLLSTVMLSVTAPPITGEYDILPGACVIKLITAVIYLDLMVKP